MRVTDCYERNSIKVIRDYSGKGNPRAATTNASAWRSDEQATLALQRNYFDAKIHTDTSTTEHENGMPACTGYARRKNATWQGSASS